ncbi:TIGR03086 family metal-binding protein [Pseudonocardia acaciae]|uniref:TIGR03086 family metal-binding protein n=1 Tax=Pseudonocardia acaciae TaxID=551276 RepID=UPI00048D853A|nr:TIGR03086 family metal-binding protein [Pseudonocardia acaciae]
MTNTELTDPRPYYRRALAWTHGLMSGVRAERLGDPTPCTEFDVRALLGHLVTTVRRAKVIGEGGDPFTVPVVVTGVADDGWADAYAEGAAKLWTVWDDDRMLDVQVTAPWATIPGRVAVWAYLNETLVHGWDLAVATGQGSEADADLALATLEAAAGFLPAEPRGGHVPFAPVVEPAPGAGPTERLANWSGRRLVSPLRA